MVGEERNFGLGTLVRVTEVRVYWPDGEQEVFPGGPAGQIRELGKGSGQ